MKICELRVSENTQRRTSVPTALALLVRDGSPSCKTLCVHCKAEHYSASCETINTIPVQMEAPRKGGRCFLCLTIGHRVAQCGIKRRCYKCNRKHHQSLCDQNISHKETRTNSEGNSSQDTIVAVSRNKVQFLLQTAQTYAYVANKS